MSDWKYRIYARHSATRDYFLIDLLLNSARESQITGLRQDFGPTWDIWIEKFPREHPHAALQRRLNAREIQLKRMANAGRRKADGELKLEDVKIQHYERDAINDAIQRPAKPRPSILGTESPASPEATTETNESHGCSH